MAKYTIADVAKTSSGKQRYTVADVVGDGTEEQFDRAETAIDPIPSRALGTPSENVLRLAKDTIEGFAPPTSIDAAKRLLNPNMGSFGPNRFAQDVNDAARGNIHKQAEAFVQKPGINQNPELAAAIGTAGTIAGDALMLSPRDIQLMAAMNLASLGKVGASGARSLSAFIEKNAPKVSQALSGVNKKYFSRIYRNPKIVLPEEIGGPKSLEDAGKALEAAEVKSFGGQVRPSIEEINDPQLRSARVNAIRGAKELEAIEEIAKTDPALADQLLSDVDTGKLVIKGRRGTRMQLDQPGVKGSQKALLTEQESKFLKVMEEKYPEIRKASSDYGDAIARSKGLGIWPVLKSGDPSITRIVLGGLVSLKNPALAVASTPIANAYATALTSISLSTLEKVASSMAKGNAPELFRALTISEIARRKGNESNSQSTNQIP